MARHRCRVFLLALSFLIGGAEIASAHSGDVIGAGLATPTIDGVKSPGEWDAASPKAVFTGFTGSLLYVLLDEQNIYLALWVPDTTLTITDQFRIRFDNDHDGLNTDGDDELGVTGTGIFFDLHHDGGLWNRGDAFSHGSAETGPLDGGSFYELAHPLNSGDLLDISAALGDTLGLCIRYNNAGVANSANIYPANCMNSVNQQSLYVDVVLGASTVGVGSPSVSGIPMEVFPNPVVPGSPFEVRFAVPESGAEVDLALYSVTGRRVAELVRGSFAGGRQSVRWAPRTRDAARVAPGVYFLLLRQSGVPVGTKSILIR